VTKTKKVYISVALAVVCLFGLSLLLIAGRGTVVAASPVFSPNQELPLPLLAPVGGPNGPVSFVVRGLEPSNRTDSQGTIYVSSIRGVPGGVDLHRWSPLQDGPPNNDGTLPFVYLGQPDGCGILADGCDLLGVAEGGGDVDIAVNHATGAAVPNLPLTSLTLVPGITSTHSTDRGTTFAQPNPIGSAIPGDDRQWLDADAPLGNGPPGIHDQTVYLSFHDAATFNIDVLRSTDGGQTYVAGAGEAIDPDTFPKAGSVAPTGTANLLGQIAVDKSSCSSAGNLYQVFVAPASAAENAQGLPMRSVYVGVSKDAKLMNPTYTFTDTTVYTAVPGTNNAQIFPAFAVDAKGNTFAVWSDNSNIWMSSSTAQGRVWTAPVRVNAGATVGKANLFPAVAADAFGHVVVVWFGSDRAGSSNDAAVMAPCDGSTTCMQQWANWNVYAAETVKGTKVTPAFTQYTASDHVIHRGTVSSGGLGGSANRDLGDYFQVSLDPQRRPNIAFSDDHKVHPNCATIGSGACGPDDPNTTRLIRANFTRKLKTASGIVTSGACATN
jgi:hypothetical protein